MPKFRTLLARQLSVGDWLIIAGEMYEVGSVTAPEREKTEIHFYDPSSPNAVVYHRLIVDNNLSMQIVID